MHTALSYVTLQWFCDQLANSCQVSITWTNIDIWLMTFLWNSLESNFTASAHVTILYDEFENHTFQITATSELIYIIGGCLLAMGKSYQYPSATE